MPDSQLGLVWKTSRRILDLGSKPLLMAIINVTPDSFSDGGAYLELDAAIAAAEKALEEGADIIDIGGESTRPGSRRVSVEEESERIVPLVEDLARRFEAPISVDTSKAEVARRALNAGAEIINDISAFRFDPGVAAVCAESGAGIVLMHSRGAFEEMHSKEPVPDIFKELVESLSESVQTGLDAGIAEESIVIDPGIGFGKSFEQNLELVGASDRLRAEINGFPVLIGVSRKSFIGRILDDAPVSNRLHGTLAANAVALMGGANVVRVHDVGPHFDLIQVLGALRK
ncbi:MAG: dihydropteroate synthase [Acidobacteria bacterium]|nr:MAG: dihydropteroate synthase [Acidobacteriota bacterium]REK01229.1 MAG: dihydropteroate synthase [Acidobacteriota bacterium]REK14185.1 MAG: dihydropteroate synthase [Acidobacteriota bacterium]REK44900.1 MAG: dihydropteroate synthase [Acidobacteriota bacterium]